MHRALQDNSDSSSSDEEEYEYSDDYSSDTDDASDESDTENIKKHSLDDSISSMLQLANQVDKNPLTNCNVYPNIPEISFRCFLKWNIGKQLARGTSAVIYETEEGENVARITQFKTKELRKGFENDVKIRYLLRCGTGIPITHLVDAFICKKNKNSYGVTITKKYHASVVEHLISIHSESERNDFIKLFAKEIPKYFKRMHNFGVAHRDVHLGNVLFTTYPKNTFAITDFDAALSKFLGATDQVMSAYINSDNVAVRNMIMELGLLNDYLTTGTLPHELFLAEIGQIVDVALIETARNIHSKTPININQ
jgi:serine/threonine protein kinase